MMRPAGARAPTCHAGRQRSWHLGLGNVHDILAGAPSWRGVASGGVSIAQEGARLSVQVAVQVRDRPLTSTAQSRLGRQCRGGSRRTLRPRCALAPAQQRRCTPRAVLLGL
eukprot:scaffold7112_cov255-Prasinococcus_capsulatus_cf.AAC.1